MSGNNPSPTGWAAARATALIAIVIAVLSLFALAVGSSNAPPYPMPNLHKADSPDEDADNKGKEPFWQRATSDPIAVFTLVLTVFTGILAWATYSLWKATERLVKDAEDTSERQLRAYVTLDHIGSQKIVTDTGQITSVSFQPILMNSGQTIARKVSYYTTMNCFYADDVPDARFGTMPGESVVSTIIGPHQMEHGPATKQIKATEFIELVRNRATILIYGAVSYTDVFEKPRRTEFSAFFDAGGHSDGSREIVFTKTAEHNNADEDCMREPYATATSPFRNPPKT